MSLEPLVVSIEIDTSRFEAAMREAIAATARFTAALLGTRHGIFALQHATARHRSRVQYRRKSRGHQ